MRAPLPRSVFGQLALVIALVLVGAGVLAVLLGRELATRPAAEQLLRAMQGFAEVVEALDQHQPHARTGLGKLHGRVIFQQFQRIGNHALCVNPKTLIGRIQITPADNKQRNESHCCNDKPIGIPLHKDAPVNRKTALLRITTKTSRFKCTLRTCFLATVLFRFSGFCMPFQREAILNRTTGCRFFFRRSGAIQGVLDV